MSTLLLESVVESNIVTAIAALSVTGVTVQGFWCPALAGDAKTSNAAPVGNIFVAVQPRGYGSYGNKTVRFQVGIKVEILPSNDSDASGLPTVFNPVINLCMSWKNDAAAARSALSTSGQFSCDGATITPGGQIGFTRETWSASIAMEIAGTEV